MTRYAMTKIEIEEAREAEQERTREALAALFTAQDVEQDAQPRTLTCGKHGEYMTRIAPRYVTDQLKATAGRVVPMVEQTHCLACYEAREQIGRELLAHIDYREKLHATRRQLVNAARESGIGERHLFTFLDGLTARGDEQAEAITLAQATVDNLRQGLPAASLLLLGKVGTGKTLIASAAVQSAIRDGLSAELMTVAQLIRTWRASWHRNAERTEQQVLDHLSWVGLLVLDEVGVQKGTDAELDILFELLNARYNNCLPTIFLSNLPLAVVRDYLGDRVMSRLKEDGGRVVGFNLDDQRAAPAA